MGLCPVNNHGRSFPEGRPKDGGDKTDYETTKEVVSHGGSSEEFRIAGFMLLRSLEKFLAAFQVLRFVGCVVLPTLGAVKEVGESGETDRAATERAYALGGGDYHWLFRLEGDCLLAIVLISFGRDVVNADNSAV